MAALPKDIGMVEIQYTLHLYSKVMFAWHTYLCSAEGLYKLYEYYNVCVIHMGVNMVCLCKINKLWKLMQHTL